MSLAQDKDVRFAIGKCKELTHLSDEELDLLLSIGSREVYNKGEEVFTIDHEGKKFYVVIEGRLLLRLRSNESKEYKQGELFGEVAILGNTLRFGTIRASENSMLIAFNRQDLFFSDGIPKNLALKVTLALTRKVISYFEDSSLQPTKRLIEIGECDYIEFKKSINKSNKEVIIKTLAGFMNLNGGTVLCGIDDKTAKVIGVDLDQKGFDEMQKILSQEIRNKLGSSFRRYVSYDIERIDNKKIVRIECESSRSPVFFKKLDRNGDEKEYFVVRSGSENRTIKKTSEVISYVQERFKRK